MPISPLAPTDFPAVRPIAGLDIRTGRAGYAYDGRDDVLYLGLPEGSCAAGVLTQSATRSPEVDWCRKVLASETAPRALWVNAGNSNAFTGSRGQHAADQVTQTLQAAFEIDADSIYLASTGVIGVPLPADKATAAINAIAQNSAQADWQAAASAIMTTDTFPKAACRVLETPDGPVTLSGIAKGSGMIAPDMATMLAFVFTDAKMAKPALQQALAAAVGPSFNSITVDSDTSTSDTLLAFATGQGAVPEQIQFTDALTDLCIDLAQQVVRDGEGATKFITVRVTGAISDASAKKIALSVANSPLVKTAIAGEDANWGRVVMAVGKAGEPAQRDQLSISFGGIAVARDGAAVEGYEETPVAQHLKGQTIELEIGLGLGAGKARIWTCDLTHSYIDINADYRS
ncbi:MAG: bifunctional glutamate N-acetyltransferase/amino-acid acetyltransferase ArgJ [Pseudomonadota bacterium]